LRHGFPDIKVYALSVKVYCYSPGFRVDVRNLLGSRYSLFCLFQDGTDFIPGIALCPCAIEYGKKFFDDLVICIDYLCKGIVFLNFFSKLCKAFFLLEQAPLKDTQGFFLLFSFFYLCNLLDSFFPKELVKCCIK
jgi:hypothetical protein